MVFEIKKIRTETLNEYLVSVRVHMGLSLDEVADKTGICVKFLEYLENGSYNKLPPTVYVIGFLRQLAQLYAVPVTILLEQFKKERGIVTQVVAAKSHTKGLRGFFSSIVLTPKFITLGVAASFVVLTIVYLAAELVLVSSAPSFTLLEPTPGQLVTKSFVNISGTTEPGTTVTVNGQDTIFVDQDGNFSTTFSVVSGQTNLVFKAENKFSKATTRNIPIVVDLPHTAADQPARLSIKLDFTQPVVLGLKVDGVELPQEQVAAGSSKVITGNDLVLISTSDGGSTLATVNGQKWGKLGRAGEKMKDIPVSSDSITLIPKSITVFSENSAFSN